MARPMYETQTDVDKELEVMEFMESVFKYPVTYSKLPKSYQIDYGVYDGDKALKMVCEIKSRNIKLKTYPDLILSAHKMHELVNWHTRGIAARLLYRLDDGLYFYRVTTDAYQLNITEGGRTDRGDWQDIEPVYHIPTSSLTELPQWTHSS